MPGLVHRLYRAMLTRYPFPRGQGRIIDRTPLRRLRFDEARLTVTTSDGFAMNVIPNDHIGRHLYLTGQFDRTIVEVLLHFARRGDCMWDIGANIGYVSCCLLHRVPALRVVAIEPLSVCYELLVENLANVGGQRASALNVAISDSEGEATMIVNPRNIGASWLERSGEASSAVGKPRITVKTIDGDRLVRESGLGCVDLIKIDVEGHEDVVLSTLTPVIKRDRPRAIVFEHRGDLCSGSSSIRHTFESLDYQLFGIRKSLTRWWLVSLAGLARSGRLAHDYVATPR